MSTTPTPARQKPRNSWLTILLIIAFIAVIIWMTSGGTSATYKSLGTFLTEVKNNEVETVQVRGNEIKVRLVGSTISLDDFPSKFDYYTKTGGLNTYVLTELETYKEKVQAENKSMEIWRTVEQEGGIAETGTRKQYIINTVELDNRWFEYQEANPETTLTKIQFIENFLQLREQTIDGSVVGLNGLVPFAERPSTLFFAGDSVAQADFDAVVTGEVYSFTGLIRNTTDTAWITKTFAGDQTTPATWADVDQWNTDNPTNLLKLDKTAQNTYVLGQRINASTIRTHKLNANGTAYIVNNFDYHYDQTPAPSLFSRMLPYILIIGVSVLMFFFVLRAMNKSGSAAMSFGRSRAKLGNNSKVTFNDVAGAEEEKEELKEVVEFLKHPQKFIKLGARIPKGFLMVGPPGTGKTLLARAVAGESNVPFFSITGSDFVEMFVGVGASRVRDLFEQAKNAAPCIVFIDEIDAVGRQRGAGLGGGNDEREQTLNQLLTQMDGFETNSGVVVMAATNRADVLDPALLRPGRFDRQIYVYPPDIKGREEIMKVHARGKPLAADVDLKELARLTTGFTGADIERLLNEAAILAARANKTVIEMMELQEAIMKVSVGPQKKSRVVTDKEKRETAYHEAGHAVVARELEEQLGVKVSEVSIIPRGSAAGYTAYRPEEDVRNWKQKQLEADLTMALGGRAAEEIVLGDFTTGAVADIRHVTDLARRMVMEFGMSNLGPINYASGTEVFLGRDYSRSASYSGKKAEQIDDEIKKHIDAAYLHAMKILKSKRAVMDEMVKLLLERETILKKEVDLLMQGKTAAEVSKIVAAEDKKRKDEIAKKNAQIAEEFAAKARKDAANKELFVVENALNSAKINAGKLSAEDEERIKKAFEEATKEEKPTKKDDENKKD